MNTLVSICCLTYNHETYIRECLESFIKQKTNFKFEVLIHDDASTDNTASIIREYEAKYPDIIKPIYQTENQYSKGVGVTRVYQFPRAIGKYIALCEGDDYWTDPYKLQKQVDFLEANPEYGMVHTDVNILYDKNKKIIYNYNKSLNRKVGDYIELSIERMLDQHYPIFTLTIMFRKDIYDYYNVDNIYKQNLSIGDLILYFVFSKYTKIKYLSDTTATYRILSESASHSKNINKIHEFNKNAYKIKKYFAEQYGCSDNVKKKIEIDYYLFLLYDSFLLNDKNLANDSYRWLKSNSIQLSVKDNLIYYSHKLLPLKYLISFYIKMKNLINMNLIENLK